MPFDYKTSGLPANRKWEVATKMCNDWLVKNMAVFGDEGHIRFMHDQPVSAAKRIMENCEDWSEESVTLVLLGPAKGLLVAAPEIETVSRGLFGDRTIDLLKTMIDPKSAKDAEMTRDVERIAITEGISTMTDQMIGRARIDQFHSRRWMILESLEAMHKQLKGQNPALDVIFEDAARQSRDALTKLDEEAKRNPKPAPKPPGHGHGGPRFHG